MSTFKLRSLAFIAIALGAHAAASGCNGHTTSAPADDAGASAGEASDAGTGSASQPAKAGASHGSAASGGVAGGGKPSLGGAAGSHATGGSSGGVTGLAEGGQGADGSLGGTTHQQAGSSGFGNGGYPAGYICIDGVCGFECHLDGIIADPGTTFWDACNQCECGLDGVPSCETKDCDLDCAYLANEYEGAYGEAQYCELGPTPDPCVRVQLNDLDCNCLTPVSSVPEFKVLTAQWAKKWQDAGCTKAPDAACPLCPPVGTPYCDTEQGICRYK